MKFGMRRILLRHCAWCQPFDRGWRSLLSIAVARMHLPVRWTSGACGHCLAKLRTRAALADR